MACKSYHALRQGTLTLILKGESYLLVIVLVWNLLFQDNLGIFFHFQNNLVLTSKDMEVNRTDTCPFRIKVSVPCLNLISLLLSSSWVSEQVVQSACLYIFVCLFLNGPNTTFLVVFRFKLENFYRLHLPIFCSSTSYAIFQLSSTELVHLYKSVSIDLCLMVSMVKSPLKESEICFLKQHSFFPQEFGILICSAPA